MGTEVPGSLSHPEVLQRKGTKNGENRLWHWLNFIAGGVWTASLLNLLFQTPMTTLFSQLCSLLYCFQQSVYFVIKFLLLPSSHSHPTPWAISKSSYSSILLSSGFFIPWIQTTAEFPAAISTSKLTVGFYYFFLMKNVWNLVRFLIIFVKMNKCRITRWSFHSTVKYCKSTESVWKKPFNFFLLK